jgi:hypothetical protein
MLRVVIPEGQVGRTMERVGQRLSPLVRRLSPAGTGLYPLERRLSPTGTGLYPLKRRLSPAGTGLYPLERRLSPLGKGTYLLVRSLPLGSAAPRRCSARGEGGGELRPCVKRGATCSAKSQANRSRCRGRAMPPHLPKRCSMRPEGAQACSRRHSGAAPPEWARSIVKPR